VRRPALTCGVLKTGFEVTPHLGGVIPGLSRPIIWSYDVAWLMRAAAELRIQRGGRVSRPDCRALECR
jgi:hypothetical protein